MNRYEQKLRRVIGDLKPADNQAIELAVQRQMTLAKPPASLGALEEISVRIAGMTGQVINRMDRGCVAVFCGDNGVAAEGVASAPQTVTMAQTVNFTRRLTGVGALCRSFGSELLIVDVGVKDGIPGFLYDQVPLRDTHKIISRRIRPEKGQTDNIAEGPAMTEEEALQAIAVGIEMADAIAEADFDLMGVGEMGIGNTTTSSALLSAITGEDAECTVGRGGGVNDEGFARKKEIVNRASEFYRKQGGIIRMAARDIGEDRDSTSVALMTEALATMGGFDLCAMTGAFIGSAANRMPVVIDGYISVVAALAAGIMAPRAVDYMIASHKSYEKGYSLAISTLELRPFLALEMRLGEGSGCPIAFQVIKGACDIMANMATFEEAAINDGYLDEIRSENRFQQ